MDKPLHIEERPGFGLATVMARKGVTAAGIGRALGLSAPERPGIIWGDTVALIGTGRNTWLAYAEAPEPGWADDLAARLGSLASVSDQSGAYVMLRLSGPNARTLLQRGAAIDFHPDVFGPGSVAVTVIAHIGVILWQVDARPTYDVAVFRSFASGFRHWVRTAAAILRPIP